MNLIFHHVRYLVSPLNSRPKSRLLTTQSIKGRYFVSVMGAKELKVITHLDPDLMLSASSPRHFQQFGKVPRMISSQCLGGKDKVHRNCKVSPQWPHTNNRESREIIAASVSLTKNTLNRTWSLQWRNKTFN